MARPIRKRCPRPSSVRRRAAGLFSLHIAYGAISIRTVYQAYLERIETVRTLQREGVRLPGSWAARPFLELLTSGCTGTGTLSSALSRTRASSTTTWFDRSMCCATTHLTRRCSRRGRRGIRATPWSMPAYATSTPRAGSTFGCAHGGVLRLVSPVVALAAHGQAPR